MLYCTKEAAQREAQHTAAGSQLWECPWFWMSARVWAREQQKMAAGKWRLSAQWERLSARICGGHTRSAAAWLREPGLPEWKVISDITFNSPGSGSDAAGPYRGLRSGLGPWCPQRRSDRGEVNLQGNLTFWVPVCLWISATTSVFYSLISTNNPQQLLYRSLLNPTRTLNPVNTTLMYHLLSWFGEFCAISCSFTHPAVTAGLQSHI